MFYYCHEILLLCIPTIPGQCRVYHFSYYTPTNMHPTCKVHLLSQFILSGFNTPPPLPHTHTHACRSYLPYFQYLSTPNVTNASLFWTQTPELVEMLSCMCASGANIVSSANEAPTAIVNNIERRLDSVVRWCGTTSGSSAGVCRQNSSKLVCS